jgi:hypothetical protein
LPDAIPHYSQTDDEWLLPHEFPLRTLTSQVLKCNKQAKQGDSHETYYQSSYILRISCLPYFIVALKDANMCDTCGVPPHAAKFLAQFEVNRTPAAGAGSTPLTSVVWYEHSFSNTCA